MLRINSMIVCHHLKLMFLILSIKFIYTNQLVILFQHPLSVSLSIMHLFKQKFFLLPYTCTTVDSLQWDISHGHFDTSKSVPFSKSDSDTICWHNLGRSSENHFLYLETFFLNNTLCKRHTTYSPKTLEWQASEIFFSSTKIFTILKWFYSK